MSSKLCPFCMRMTESDTCPHCGKSTNYAGSPMHLPAGYVVSGKHPYVLGAALGQGGFGITYIALDMVTDDRVAIKEYFPTFCASRTDGVVSAYSNQEETFLKGRERFLDEARVLKSLSDLKCIVNVLDFFEFNNSAYLVMEFLEGSSLKDYAAKNGKFPAQKFLSQIRPLMEDIERMHQRGVVHRDIAPDNIMLLPDGQMKLIDFGTARSFIGDRSMTVVVKKGFAPLEQYLTKGTTPSTDVYALAATIYYCITGTVPMDSAERQYDGTPLASPSALGADLAPRQERALAKALAVQQKARTQSVQAFLDDLKIKQSVKQKPKSTAPKPEPKETALGEPSGLEANVTSLQEKAKDIWKESGAKSVQKVQDNHSSKQPIKPKPKPLAPKKEPKKSVPAELTGPGADIIPAPDKPLEIQKESSFQSVQKIQDDHSDKKSVKPKPQKSEETALPGRKMAIKIAAAILVAITAFGFFLNERRPKAAKERLAAQVSETIIETTEIPTEAVTIPTEISESIPTEPAVEEPAWKKNVLMADVAFDADSDKFWQEEFTGHLYDIYNYFSKRPIFNTEIPRSKVTDVFFLDSFSTAPEIVYDVSANQDGSVLAWTEKNRKGALNLYIAGEGGVNGSEACRALFYGYKELESVHFNHCFFTDTAKDMSSMFAYCKKLTTIDLVTLNTASATDMSSMFSSCELLKSLDLSSFDTSSVKNMSFMFSSCPQLKSINLSSFDTSNTTNVSYMFAYLKGLTSIDVRHFDTSKVTDMSGLFCGCSNEKLTTLDVSGFDTSNVTDMSSMFSGCRWIEALDLRNFDTSNVTNMQSMFSDCRRITSLDLSSFDTSNVTNMQCMFEMCSMLPVLEISHFDTSQVIDMSYMFYKCGYLKTMDITQCDVSNVQITTNMFYGCDKLPLEYKKIGGKYIWSSWEASGL